jgi:hypothetical protein
MSDKSAITILTLAIGGDYRRGMSRCLGTKVSYANHHGYRYIEGDDEWWDRGRPIAWSKMGFYIHWLEKALLEGRIDDVFWLSDADVYITNPEIKIENHIQIPADKDMLVCIDSFDHVNSGNIFVRPTKRVIDWLRWVDSRKECVNHIWWENGAMLLCWNDRPSDLEWVEIDTNPTKFNAYLRGLPERAVWQRGDWLVHFAGVYDPKEIGKLIDRIEND